MRKDSLTLPYSLVQATVCMCFCVAISFSATHMQEMGFSNTELGIVIAAGNLFGSLLGPALASLSEKNPRFETAALNLPLFALRALFLFGLIFIPRHTLATAVIYAVYIAVTIAVNSLNLKFCVDAELRGLPLDFGIARGIGSLAYVFLSSVLGIFTQRFTTTILPYVGLAMLLLQVAANSWMGRALNRKSAPVLAMPLEQPVSLLRFFRKEPRFSVLMLGLLLIFFFHSTGATFMINLIQNVGGNAETLGYLGVIQALSEIPVMLFSRLVKGKRVSALLSFSFVMFLAKGLSITFAPNIPLLFAAHTLQSVSFAVYTCAVVPYINTVIAPQDAAKAQSMGFSVTTLAAVLASLISGRLFDICSVRTTMLIVTTVCAVGVVISLAGVKRTEPVKGPNAPAEPAL